jgi:hypothetical protein
MKQLTALAFAATALLASVGAAAAPVSLLVNGSFESLPTPLGNGQWTVLPSLAGWTIDAGSGVEVRRNVVGTAQDGDVFVELDTNAGSFGGSSFDSSTNSWISQSVATIAGAHYTLSWFYAPRDGQAADTNPIDVLWNGAKLATSNGSGMGRNAGVWQQYSFDVVGTGQLDTLTFAARGKADSVGGSLDNVSLLAIGPAAAATALPEPATAGLVLAACGSHAAAAALEECTDPAASRDHPGPCRSAAQCTQPRSVTTMGPWRPTTSVCSYCAVTLPAGPAKVHPSPVSTASRALLDRKGSIVKT